MSIPSDPKLEGFDVLQATYKQIGDHGIRADILIPRAPFTGKRPVIVRTHCGALVTGDSLDLFFWPHWLSDLALKHGAVIVSPNYRLMPETTSPEIYDDMDDFWKWLHSSTLTNLLTKHPTPTEVDLSRLLTTGDSGGGLLSVYLGLTYPTQIRATTAMYPWIDPGAASFGAPRTILPIGLDTPESVIIDTLAAMAPGDIVSSVATQDRLQFVFAAIQHGRLSEWYARRVEGSSDRELFYPMEKIEQPGLSIPRGGIAIVHGCQDTVVFLEDAEKFAMRLQEVTKGLPGGDKVVFTPTEGDHGLDYAFRWEEKEWLRDSFRQAVETWLE
ncbi:Alpha/Beta hydrolase protein [Aspergillus alliaceus]|uniref:Alpha/Beta hydrolase protein n=1 Tax=Petromyces alliaceus TaxID=209559 RepID=A0A5N7C6F3_PETAA|nr:Alpha/Beta hydrolase protein [Aspergillus alliaceus]